MDTNEQTDVEFRRKDERIRLLHVDIQFLHGRIDKLTREKRKAEIDLERVYASFSWRASSVLRAARYLLWTMPALSLQWGQRIFLDKGLIKKNQVKFEAKKNISKFSSTQKNDKSTSYIKDEDPLLGQESLPERKKNLSLALYETKHVLALDGEANPESKQVFNHADLRNPGIFRREASLAQQSGIDGFCYLYDESVIDAHFDGPIMNHYRNTDTGLYYCICWSDKSVEAEKYQLTEKYFLRKFISYCATLFEDTRYLYRDNRPLILVRGLGQNQIKRISNIWRDWCVEEEVVIPVILSMDVNVNSQIIDVSKTYKLAELRSKLKNSDGDQYLKLNQDQIDMLPSLLGNIRQYSKGILFIDSWNDWQQGLVLSSLVEANQVTMNELAFHTSLQYDPSQIVIVVSPLSRIGSVQKCLQKIAELGFKAHLILMADCCFDFDELSMEGLDLKQVARTKLIHRANTNTFRAVLRRQMKSGSQNVVLLGRDIEDFENILLEEGLNYCFLVEDEGAFESSHEFRSRLQANDIWAPKIEVICTLPKNIKQADIQRFMSQLENQTLLPTTLTFVGDNKGILIESPKISVVNVIPALDLGEFCFSGSELVWLTHLESMPHRSFLSDLSQTFTNKGLAAVVYPYCSSSEQTGILGRVHKDIQELRLESLIDQVELQQSNILGRFQEVLVTHNSLQTIFKSIASIDGVLDTQKDWLLWLLLLEQGQILKHGAVSLSSVLFRPMQYPSEYGLEKDIVTQYFGEGDEEHESSIGSWMNSKEKLTRLAALMNKAS